MFNSRYKFHHCKKANLKVERVEKNFHLMIIDSSPTENEKKNMKVNVLKPLKNIRALELRGSVTQTSKKELYGYSG